MHKQLLISLVSIVLTSTACTKKEEVIETRAKVICSDGEVKFDGAGLTGIVGGGLLKKDSTLAKGIVYIQSVDIEGHAYMCTGSLISSDLVLTAAHCVEGPKRIVTSPWLLLINQNVMPVKISNQIESQSKISAFIRLGKI